MDFGSEFCYGQHRGHPGYELTAHSINFSAISRNEVDDVVVDVVTMVQVGIPSKGINTPLVALSPERGRHPVPYLRSCPRY